MKRRTAVTSAAMALMALMVLASCRGNTPEEEGEGEASGGGMREANELFIEAEGDGSGTVTTRFRTNDKKYGGINGSTLWTVWGDAGTEEEFLEREVKTSKVRGNAAAGYGLVLCHGTREAGGKEEETMLVVMINNQGEYAIGKVVGGRYGSLVWWTRHDAVRGWSGAPNEIRISREGEEFVIGCNGAEVTRFVDGEEPRHAGGRNGYVVVISPLDRFPENEVDVYFTEKKR